MATKRMEMIAGGVSFPEQKGGGNAPSIFKDPNTYNPSRIHTFVPENPPFPEGKLTQMKTVHNISHLPVAERPGKEEYEPVLGNGKSVSSPRIPSSGPRR